MYVSFILNKVKKFLMKMITFEALYTKGMKIIIIDNYDSFTYNIAHYVEQFALFCKVVKIDEVIIDDLENYDKIILSPGPGLPNERPIQNQIIEQYYQSKPILGICLGHQALAEFFGAKLYNMKEVHHGLARPTSITNKDYIWKNIPQKFNTGRYHSWAVSSNNFPNTLSILATDTETETIMAFKHNSFNIRAIQFHPESILTENGLEIIKNWVLH